MAEVGLILIRYSFLLLGGISALATIVLILINRMCRSVYPALILAIQISNLGICLVDISYVEDSTNCQASAVFFYLFWMIGNLLTALIIFVINFDLSGLTDLRQRVQIWVLMGVLLVSTVTSLLPLYQSQYEQCGPPGAKYCGIPAGNPLLLVNYVTPLACGLVALLWLSVTRIRIYRKHSSASKKASKALKILSALYVWLAFLVANFVTNFITIDSSQQYSLRYLLLILNKLMILTPIVNLFLFIYMARNLNQLLQVQVLYCRKLLINHSLVVREMSESLQD